MNVERFLDDKGRVSTWPRKQAAKELVLAHLANAFVHGRDYTEGEVNATISRHHTFGDFFLLRREMVDRGYLAREPNGSRYWKCDR